MYKVRQHSGGSKLKVNKSEIGEPLHIKIERMVQNKEEFTDVKKELIYTDRSEGVLPEYNIRTDRWEIAIEGMDKSSKSFRARREEKMKIGKKDDGEAKSAEGTDGGSEQQ